MKVHNSYKVIGIFILYCAAMALNSSAQSLTTLLSFDGTNGSAPSASLIQAGDGNLYGTTQYGGTFLGCEGGFTACGTVFKISTGGTLATLHTFDYGDGAWPVSPVVQGSDGNFYGTNVGEGDSGGTGAIFKMTASGTLTVLHSVSSLAGLVQGHDGNFYGTTPQGPNYGTVFKITPSGTFTTLYTFNGTDGRNPEAGLIQATDGNFYGTTASGGTSSNCGGGCGTVFKMTPSGSLTTLHSFSVNDGFNVVAGMVQGSDGNFYGTAMSGGGPQNAGVVFKITPNGMFTLLHSLNNTDGYSPRAGLVQGSDGNFYGTTYQGGTHGQGTVFAITSGGSLTTLYNFCSQSGCADGANPVGGLVQAGDGNFYGTTQQGGNTNLGTVFKYVPQATLTVTTAGDGTVTSTDGHINCPSTCMYIYPGGAPVTLNANPAAGWAFSGWTGACIGVGQCQINMTQNLAVTAVFVEPGHGLQLTPITPCRVADTRDPNQPMGLGPPTFSSHEARSLPILSSPCIPAGVDPQAYSFNVAVVPHHPLNYLTMWPAGEAQPLVSTMNSYDGRVKSNAAIVTAGTQGAVSVYVTDTTDVVIDINGYFTPPTQGSLQFYPLPPCRVADTRSSSNLPPGLGPPSMGARETRTLPILSADCFQGVTNPRAYSFNVTVDPTPRGQALNFLTLWPSGTRPLAATLNNPTATVVANAAIVPAADDGSVEVFATNSTDVIIDVNGYFAAPASGYSFYAAAPCRAYDSRNGGGPLRGTRVIPIAGSPCAAPSSAAAYILNASVVPQGFLDYLTLWPDQNPQQPPPGVATLNAYDGIVTSNMAIVPNLDGSIDTYASQLTHLILDISAYFAP